MVAKKAKNRKKRNKSTGVEVIKSKKANNSTSVETKPEKVEAPAKVEVELEEAGMSAKVEKESERVETSTDVEVGSEKGDVSTDVEVKPEIGEASTDIEEEELARDENLAEKASQVAAEGEVAATDEIPEQVVKELKTPIKRERKLFPALWWVLGVAALVLVGVSAAGVLGVFGGKDDEPVAVTDDTSQTEEEPKEPAEEEPTENKPAEDEKPEEPVPEKPEPEQPKPTETPTTPIAPRPGNTADPEVTPGSKLIALTFDDGPSATTTPRLLDILQGRRTKATFFVLGTMARRSPDILRREVAEGHEVASHTPYHNQLTTLTPAQVRAEALEMDQIFTEILGTVPPFTRPPYGSFNATVGEALGQPMILWSIDPRDWQDRNASTVCSRVVSAARDGAIILVHDIHATTVDAVPCIIDTLRAQGYEFLTVSELAAARDVPMISGTAYYSF